MNFWGGKNGEEDIGEVLDLLLKDKPINETQRETFFRTDFWTIMRTSAAFINEKYSDALVPKIISKINEKAPKFFGKDGIDVPAQIFNYKSSKRNCDTEMISIEEELKLTEIKEAFNLSLNTLIESSYSFNQFTDDYDLLGKAKSLESKPTIRGKYLNMGSSRLQALKNAISKNNAADFNVFMRVRNPDSTYYAPEPASKLIDAGVKIWNNLTGERFGAFRTGETLSDCNPKLKNLLKNFEGLKTINEATGIDKKTLERIERDEIQVSYKDAKALQTYFSKQIGDTPTSYSSVQLVKEVPHIFSISREFPQKTEIQVTEPQIHKEWKGIIIPYWENGCAAIENYAGRRKLEENRITKDILKPSGY
jgi:transcriptional regulator with XRE-family HTH domain